jgi:starch synthase
MKIAFCVSEVVPFAKTGGLADVSGALPLALEAAGLDVIIVMPGYPSVDRAGLKRWKLSPEISCACIGKELRTYFIDNEEYFGRESLYTDSSGHDYPDNPQRFAYFCRKSLDLLKEIRFKADIVHVHDWQTSLIPVFMKTPGAYADDVFYRKMKTVLTVHNLGYQGIFGQEDFARIGLDRSLFTPEALEFYGKMNLLKGGIVFSDVVNTVSPTYSREIQTRELGFGLADVLAQKKSRLYGILNGLDYAVWNPQNDSLLIRQYGLDTIEDKAANKEWLQERCKLPVDSSIPVVGIVSRLVDQKGCDLILESIGALARLGIQLIVLGIGEAKYHVQLQKEMRSHPRVVSANFTFDETLAHRIYAGSDIFLMPSRYEPCGLGQMIALRYGTIPVVHKTGGLADTVTQENGFVFDSYRTDSLVEAVRKAAAEYAVPARWFALMGRAMQYRFSWETSAGEYRELYEHALTLP